MQNLYEILKTKYSNLNELKLKEISYYKPFDLNELSQLKSLTKKDIKDYGMDIIWDIKRYETLNSFEFFDLDPNTEVILNKLEAKLINLNKRNKMIYLNKLYKKNSFDLFYINYKINDLIFNKEKIEICKKDDNYNKIKKIFNEVDTIFKDTGVFTLYIGYPFVEGLLSSDLYIKAPLVLFPIIYFKSRQQISIKLDETKDIIYNNHLLLLNKKINKIKDLKINNNIIENLNKNTFYEDIIKYYHNNKLDINFKPHNITEYSFIESNKNLNIINNIILGKFLVNNDSIQKDYDYIIENKYINNLLNTLLKDLKDESKIYKKTNKNYLDKNTFVPYFEKDLFYINSLNNSQEEILYEASNDKSLIIEGPPGTGKSQTITELITQFINNDKNILMVCEKKAALNVVYSRLKELSNYAVLIDNISNKDKFFNQIKNILNLDIKTNYQNDDEIINVSNEIDNILFNLKDLGELLFNNKNNLEIYKLYLKVKKFDLTDDLNVSIYNSKSLINSSQININNIDTIFNKFNNINTFTNLDNYYNLNKKYQYFKDNIDNIEYNHLLNYYQELKNKKGLFLKNKLNKLEKKLNDYYNKDINNNYIFIDDKEFVLYKELKNYLKNFTTDELDYYKMIKNLVKEKNIDYLTANKKTYEIIIYNYLNNFDKENFYILLNIIEYDNIISKLNNLLQDKKNLVKDRTIYKLNNYLNNLKDYKDEISSYINSKKRKTVSNFFKLFSLIISKNIRIFLLTPEVVSEILPLKKSYFDLLIFDEASQMYIEKSIPSLVRSKQVIIAGDSMQLRPQSLGNSKIDFNDDYDIDLYPILEEESLLDVAKNKFDSLLLNYHYRSKYEELITFSNFGFYNAKLNVCPNINTNNSSIIYHKIDNGKWINRENKYEAIEVINILNNLLVKDNTKSFGIITFNSDQKDLIEDLIEQRCNKDSLFNELIEKEKNKIVNDEDHSLFIRNIENVQGDERDIIIFSIGYAKDEKGRVQNRFGWLTNKSGENRLNVGITRSKEQMIIVTSINPEDLDVDKTTNEGPKLLKKFLTYCKNISEKNYLNNNKILSSLLEDDNIILNENNNYNNVYNDYFIDLENKLKDLGYEYDKNIGIGKYKIDIAIKKNNKYVLGIEYDFNVYTKNTRTKERDFYRLKFFQSKGWNIYRLYSRNWYLDKNKEINNIIDLLSKSFD